MSNVNYQVWTTEEDNLLQNLVNGKMSYKEISSKFKNRSSDSLRLRATRYLNLKNTGYFHHLYKHNEKFWEAPNSINSYWAGFSAADASITHYSKGIGYSFKIELARVDKSHLELFKKTVSYDGIIVDLDRPNKVTSRIAINSCNQWKADLERNFNIVPNKTKILPPPNLEDDYLKFCYLIGYIDGDGCICLDKLGNFSISFASASPIILEWIKNLTDRFTGQRNTKRFVNYKQRYATFRICGGAAKNLFNYLTDFPVPKLSRKWNKEIVEFCLK